MALVKNGGAVAPDKIQTNDKTGSVIINTSNDSIEFTTGSTQHGIIDSSGNIVFGVSSGAQGIDFQAGLASTNFGATFRNTSTGDVKLTLSLSAQSYSLGVDNSDGDNFKISTSSNDVGVGTIFTLTPAGAATFSGTLDAGTNSIINVVDPTGDQHAATKKYVDDEITSATTANNELGELVNVTDTSTASGFVLHSTGAESWATSAIGSASGVQAHSNDLDSISGLGASLGLLARSAAGTVVTRDLVESTSNAITISNGDGVSGNPSIAIQAGLDSIAGLTTSADKMIYTTASNAYAVTDLTAFARTLLDDSTDTAFRATLGVSIGSDVQAWDTDLDALAGVSSTGMLIRTGAGSATTRQLAESTTNAITITDADGVSGNPTIDIQAGLDSIAGLTTAADRMIYTTASNVYNTADLTSFARQLLDDANASTARSTLQLNAGEAGDIWVEKAGDIMTGLLTLSGDPTASLHAATKQYVDSLAAGLDPKGSCVAAPTSTLSGYSAVGGTSGTGGFTNIDTTTFDGHSMSSGDRVLVLNQTDTKQNGIYVITTVNATTGAMERSTDHDGTPSNEVSGGNTTFVENGTTYSGRTYSLQGDGNLTLNTDNLVWQLLSNAGDWSWGTGLANSGNTVNAVLEGTGVAGSLGTLSFNGDNIAVDLGFTATTALRGDAQIGQLSNVNTSGVSNGNTLYYDAGTWRAASQVFWDETNDRLGISESAPETKLHINGGTGNLEVLIESTDAESGLQLRDNTGSTNLMTVGDLFQIRPAGTTAVEVSSAGLTIEGSGRLFIQDGSAASPALAFDTDQDTGIYSDGAGGFAISVGGSPSLILNSNAQLIIGNGTAALPKYSFFNDQDTGIYLAATGELGFSTAGTQRVEIKAAGLELLTGQLLNLDGVAGAPTYSFTSDPNSGIFSPAADTIGFSTNGNERVRITSSTFELTDLQIQAGGGTAAAPIYSFDTDTNTGIYRSAIDSLSIATAGTQRLVVNASGDVGIGQSGPGAKVHIGDAASDSNTVLRIEASSLSTINFADLADANVGLIQYNHTDNSMAFNTNDAERLSIESDGEVIVTNKVTLGTDGSLDHGTASTSATTQVSIFEFPLATYMGAKVIVCVEDTTATESTISELLITHDGVTAVSTQYATVSTDTDRATFDVDINTGNVRLLATPISTNNMTFKVMSTQLLA